MMINFRGHPSKRCGTIMIIKKPPIIISSNSSRISSSISSALAKMTELTPGRVSCSSDSTTLAGAAYSGCHDRSDRGQPKPSIAIN
ncbi:hypothetical protein AWZ03_015165 [Drosophila navojoa]|uniref:Uncharacterized protein n=1 Tax=Drosophila navojoa TaxID=7232 RepID=A0A484ANC7_DRONA|nr:hypothetical protein AWZ03_015165 [Drosophila navojoa]